jgi:hypothetical protein
LEKDVIGLIELIQKEVDSLENFLWLLTEEEECLINNRFNQLQESIHKQEQAILRAKQLEKERMEMTAWLSAGVNFNQERTSLSKLIQLLDSSYSSKLEELQKTLLELHRKVEAQRDRNEELIKESMGYIDRDIIILMDDSPTSYLKEPSNNPGKVKPSLVLNKAG